MVGQESRQLRQHRGIVLLTALLVVTGLTTLTTVGLTRAMTEQRMAQHEVGQARLFQLAEAGFDDAIQQRLAITTQGEMLVSYHHAVLGVVKHLGHRLKNNLPRELVRDNVNLSL